MRFSLTVVLCLVVLLSAPFAGAAADSREALVQEVLAATPLIDGHNDAPWAIRDRWSNQLGSFDFHDTASIDKPMHTDLKRLKEGGVGAQFWSVWVPTDLEGGDAVTTVIEQIDLVHRLVDRYPDEMELALTASDIRRIHSDGKIASLIGIEGGHSIDNSMAVLRALFQLGARYMTLTHWQNVDWCDAATEAPEHDGLTDFGEAVVGEMNRLGMMVDLSHVSAEVMRQVLDITKAPVIFSHSSAFAINPHPRNVPDDILRQVTENAGVVMVNFGSYFLAQSHTERWAALKAEREKLKSLHPGDPDRVKREMDQWMADYPVPTVGLSVLGDHVEHIRNIAGIDHVGLGSDYDGIGALPEEMGDVTGYPRLLAELARRGWNREDLGKLAGENLMRVMADVEKVAIGLQKTRQPEEMWFEGDDS
ncbi:MAG: membrane dipeptidase [Acidobacteria bacterium]|nr:MAG: membrane dipeptidase [Acidobacteriota bacterium]